ncbi:signal peptide peptidase SppA [Leptolyngbya sp. BL0902]|uniref:signal peptide peptidase SppA n=1 Tax=Leptolyngbya sp. BL0902 TaxID=1115757 RepID=UPI0018E8C185|nr:signal peptide peptidase SppA [Leptolyngbya sp. BL0902]QQE65118.1 signal peptide peptidase SppA [Leptolyngbya sp. BL0902]
MRQFLKYTLASFTGSVLFFLVAGGLLALGAVGLTGALIAGLARGGGSPTVEKDSVLVYDLGTLVPDTPMVQAPGDFVVNGRMSPQVALRQVVLALEAAAEDDRIVALYLKGSSTVGMGLANQQEITQVLTRFQASGKPILAYDVSWSEREYALVALADTVYLHPFGDLEMNGLYSETLYQADALEKLGIGVQVTRTGAYKSAVEPFTNNAMSPQEREQTQRLLQEIWQGLLTAMAQPRSLTPQQLQAIANTQGLLFGEAAKTAGLVDDLAYEDEVVAALRELTGESDDDGDNAAEFRQIDLPTYAATVEDEWATRSASAEVAVVYAEGPIVYGDSGSDGLGTGVIAGDTLARQLRQLRQNDEVKAVVLRVNSPGGSALASEVILREVQLIQAKGIPVVVSMGDVAASGGYWIAASADAIVAQPGTITGSIGVFSLFLNLEDLSNRVGLNWEGVKTAELADIFSVSRPKTEQELGILQGTVDTLYNAFLDRVEGGRQLPRAEVANLAQGRVWSGQAGQSLGLVDELGGLQQAIETAANLAELSEDWRIESYPKPSDWQQFWVTFLGAQGQARGRRPLVTQPFAVSPLATDTLTAQGERFLGDSLALIATLNDPRGLYMRLPYTLRLD